jgi:hypothetical protein
MGEKNVDGERWFLLGVFEFHGVFWMVNRGEVVVNCVVNVVRCVVPFWVEKHANFSKYILANSRFGPRPEPVNPPFCVIVRRTDIFSAKT